MKTVQLCNENYVEIYDLQKNILVSRVKQTEINGVIKLDIKLVTTNATKYCDYCYDKIKDYDEESVDCGGANCPACIEMPLGADYQDMIIKWLKWLMWLLSATLTAALIGGISKGIVKKYIIKAKGQKHAVTSRAIAHKQHVPHGIIKKISFR